MPVKSQVSRETRWDFRTGVGTSTDHQELLAVEYEPGPVAHGRRDSWNRNHRPPKLAAPFGTAESFHRRPGRGGLRARRRSSDSGIWRSGSDINQVGPGGPVPLPGLKGAPRCWRGSRSSRCAERRIQAVGDPSSPATGLRGAGSTWCHPTPTCRRSGLRSHSHRTARPSGERDRTRAASRTDPAERSPACAASRRCRPTPRCR